MQTWRLQKEKDVEAHCHEDCCAQGVRPHIDTLVVDLEKGPQCLPVGVEVHSVAGRDKLVTAVPFRALISINDTRLVLIQERSVALPLLLLHCGRSFLLREWILSFSFILSPVQLVWRVLIIQDIDIFV